MEEITKSNKQVQRPQLLTVLAVLSFIGSGLALFSNAMTLLFYNAILNVDMSEISAVYTEMFWDSALQDSLSVISEAGRVFFVASAFVYAGSLYGVYKMWNLQKEGLHYYAISQFVILLLPLIFVSPQMPVLSGFLVSTLFVLLYYRSFKMMENEY